MTDTKNPAPQNKPSDSFAKLATELDIDWVSGLFGSAEYGSGEEFLADVAKRLGVPAPKPNVLPLVERIASVEIWQDFYPDGPDKMAGALALTPQDVRDCRSIIAATEGSAPDYSEAASGYNSPPHLIADDTAPQNNVAAPTPLNSDKDGGGEC